MHIQMIESGIFRNRDQTVTHSPEIKREIPFFPSVCTRKRSETYTFVKILTH